MLLSRKSVFGIALICCLYVVQETKSDFNHDLLPTPGEGRHPKLINLFNVVRFQNNACQGASRNGTCYTNVECTQKGGASDGSCAGGFGVCCIFSLGCGTTSSENCTYFTQTAFTSVTSNPCVHTACKCHNNVCRFRLDFVDFTIADPVVTTVAATLGGDTIGDCTVDTFAATSPGNRGSPIICGYNTGQHMFLDATDACSELSFDIGNGDTSTRSFDIKITQYECGSEKGGPPDCLQYFTSSTGQISSFNFRTDQTTTSTTATHLSNQCYSACFRRSANQCKICFFPQIVAAAPISFGLSNTATIIAQSEIDAQCVTDYIVISGAQNVATTNSLTGSNVQRLCGRIFNAAAIATITTATVCSLVAPFRLDVKFDDTELIEVIAGDQTTINTENSGVPSGNTGFSLGFVMSASCA